MHELLQHKLTLNERGKLRKITAHEAILRRILEDCLKGNVKSAAFLLNRYQAMNSDEAIEPDLSQDDQAVLQAYVRKYKPKPNEGSS